MLYEFKSKATGTVVMMQPVAERILGIIGKPPGATGIITVAQMPAAIAALEAAVAQERGQPAVEEQDEDGRERPRRVSLAQRAWPFLEMLRDSLRAEKDVTWGV
jgi:cyclopropane-fatty-acyl-phospholipid synthase